MTKKSNGPSQYVWGVKNPSRVANQYKIYFLKKIIREELLGVLREQVEFSGEREELPDFIGEYFGWLDNMESQGYTEDEITALQKFRYGPLDITDPNLFHREDEDSMLDVRDIMKAMHDRPKNTIYIKPPWMLRQEKINRGIERRKKKREQLKTTPWYHGKKSSLAESK